MSNIISPRQNYENAAYFLVLVRFPSVLAPQPPPEMASKVDELKSKFKNFVQKQVRSTKPREREKS